MKDLFGQETIDVLRYALIALTSVLCSLYIYIKSLKIELSRVKTIYMLASIIILSVFITYLRVIGFSFYVLVFIILTVVFFLTISKTKLHVSIPTAIISIGISYCIEMISVTIMVTICSIIKYYDVNLLTELFTSIIECVITYFFMKIKRFKNGFAFLENKTNFGIGIVICGPIITLVSISKDYTPIIIRPMIAIGILISIIGLFIWIRNAFIRHYRKRLKLRAEEYSKIELVEKSKEIEKLKSENTSLSSIIHLDNHIIQSIETELNNLNNSELTNKLLISINQRNEYVNDTLVKSKNLPTTGSADIDAVLADLYIKAASRGIDYNLNVDCDINYLLNNLFSKDDFEILLRETITNAIVSVENNRDTPGRILINISQPNDIYELTIMDNGITKNDINSISEIIKKSNASILTKNYDDNDSFTNSITVRFDGLNTNTQ